MKKSAILLMALSQLASAAPSESEAQQLVQNQACKDGESVAQFLDHKSSSHRDLGWRVFPADGGFDVERAFLASKSMELRYRWRVGADGQVQAVSDRAQNLCS